MYIIYNYFSEIVSLFYEESSMYKLIFTQEKAKQNNRKH